MEQEKIFIEKSREQEPQEVSRYELDHQQKIDIVIQKTPGAKLPEELESADVEAIQVVIQKEGKDFLNFKDLFSKETHFIFRSEKEEKSYGSNAMWGWALFDKFEVIIMPRIWEEGAKDVLAILHESGHTLDTNKERNDKMLYLESRMDEIIKHGTEQEAEEFKIIIKEYSKLMSQSERYAWAKALNIAKKLKKEKGIDTLKPFQGKTPIETRKNLEEYIDGSKCLGYYESEYIMGSDRSEELKGFFTTKFYKGEKFSLEHRKKIREKE